MGKTTKKSNKRSWKERESKDERRDFDKRKRNADMEAAASNDKVSSRNDPQWYHHNDQLVKDAGRFSFNRAIGAPINLNKGYFNSLDDFNNNQTTIGNVNGQASNSWRTPGIMVYPFTITYGRTFGDGTDPINVAAFSIYSNIRQRNSGSANYDASALMMYMMAMDSMYTFYMHLARIYGCMNISNPVNRYMPRYLVEALGMDYDDLSANLSDFRAYLNMFAVRMNAFCVPRVMDVYKRHTQLAGNIYTDSASIKSQLYAFIPEYVYKFVEKTEAGEPIHLEAIKVDKGYYQDSHLRDKMTFAEVRSIIDEVLAPIVNNESFNIMSGDILKAYGQENCFTITMIADNYVTLPVYDQLILQQIRNATIFATAEFSLVATETGGRHEWPLYVTNDNKLASELTLTDEGWGHLGNHIIACDSDIPSEDDVFEVTRLTAAVVPDTTYSSETIASTKLYAAGSEVLGNGMECHLNGSGQLVAFAYNTAPLITGFTSAMVLAYRSYMYAYHPIIYAAFFSGTIADVRAHSLNYSVLGEFSNYTVMEDDDLRAIHDVALLSLFGVA